MIFSLDPSGIAFFVAVLGGNMKEGKEGLFCANAPKANHCISMIANGVSKRVPFF